MNLRAHLPKLVEGRESGALEFLADHLLPI